jgi:hypothetical protein
MRDRRTPPQECLARVFVVAMCVVVVGCQRRTGQWGRRAPSTAKNFVHITNAGKSNESWHAISNTLAELGYDVGPSDPGPGAVLSFDASGRGVLLTTGADLPVEYVEPIRAHVFSDASARADAPGGFTSRLILE